MRDLRAELKDEFINTRSYRSTEDSIGRDFDRAENYLSLVGLIIVILGGIAVSSVTRVFILQKIRSIAVLKCVGARSTQIINIYILQVVLLGLARQSARRRAGARARWPAIPIYLGGSIIAPGAGALRCQLERGAAGHRHRRAGVGAVLGRAAAARPLHQAVAAPPRRKSEAAASTGWGSA